MFFGEGGDAVGYFYSILFSSMLLRYDMRRADFHREAEMARGEAL